ncbi:hypothetical protein [Humibacter sp.]|jgi:hypothetical protein|uniref:hypothetical protein n=1 Tax=Humibacter sp. TaxID=1940291 RepID=UPI002C7B24BC|nr:hypothetical protein [Humibacter sp.]HVX07718.1 hypothetical protein [Humibacter sp.]
MTIPDDPSPDTPIFESQLGAQDSPLADGSSLEQDPSMAQNPSMSQGSEALGSQTQGSQQGSRGVRDEAGRVAQNAADAGSDVASVAKEQAQDVLEEGKAQASELLHQTQDELREQAAHQQERVAAGLHSISDELTQMASASESGGMASDLVRQAARRADSIATWLGDRDPGSLLSEVKSYARRNPGTFIAIAALAGAVGGRLTRALASGGSSGAGGSRQSAQHAGSGSSAAEQGQGLMADPTGQTGAGGYPGAAAPVAGADATGYWAPETVAGEGTDGTRQ